MSARAWQARRARRDHPLLLAVLDDGTDRARVLRPRRIDWARTRRLERLARRRRGLAPSYARVAAAGKAFAASLEEGAAALDRLGRAFASLPRAPWSSVDHDIVADLRAAGLNGLARSIEDTPPL